MRNSLFTGASLATAAVALGKSDEKEDTLTNAEKTFNLDYAFHDGMFRNQRWG